MTDEIKTKHTENNMWDFDGTREDAIHVEMNRDYLSVSKGHFEIKILEPAIVQLSYQGSKFLSCYSFTRQMIVFLKIPLFRNL